MCRKTIIDNQLEKDFKYNIYNLCG